MQKRREEAVRGRRVRSPDGAGQPDRRAKGPITVALPWPATLDDLH